MPKVGVVTIDLDAGTAKFLMDLDAANSRIKKFGQSAEEAGGHTVSSMQASSAAIRLMENPLGNNIRAIERLISIVPGLGKLFQSAFLFVGAGATVSLLARMGEEAAKFIHNLEQAPEKLAGSFRSLNAPLKLTNDELRLANDRLANQIAKLSGKPQNGVKVALDEAKVAADHLAESLDKDLDALGKLMKENEQGFWARVVGGGTDNSDIRDELVGKTGFGGFRQTLSGAHGDPKLSAQLLDAEIAKLQMMLDPTMMRQKFGDHRDFTSRIDLLTKSIAQLQDERSHVDLSAENASLNAGKDSLQAAKENSDETVRQLKEEYDRQLAEFETYQTALAYEKAGFRRTELSNVIAQYGEQNQAIVKFEDELRSQIATLQQEGFRSGEELRKKDAEDEERYQLELLKIKVDWAKKANESLAALTKTMAANTDASGRELPDIIGMPAGIRLQGTLVGNELALRHGGVSTASSQQQQIDEARQLYQLAVKSNQPLGIQVELQERLLELEIEQGKARGDNTSGLQGQLDKLRAMQTLRQWASPDYAGSFLQAGLAAPGALGGAVANGIFGGRKGQDIGKEIENSLKNVGKQLFGQLLTQGIEKLIATILLQTGLQATFNAIFGAGTAAQVVASVANTAALGTNTAALIADAVTNLFHFAGGGEPPMGIPSVVGEKGPELFIPKTPGFIMPNTDYMRLRSSGSGSASPSVGSYQGGHTIYVTNTQHIYDSADGRESGRQFTNFLRTVLPKASFSD